MKKLLLHPLFLIGVALRLALIFLIAPRPATEWYVPFLDATSSSLFVNPWEGWLAHGGLATAFPYGYAMWFVFLPLTLLFKFLHIVPLYGYGATMSLVDFSFLLMLRRLIPGRNTLLLAVYWLSPIVIVGAYVLGFNDLVPAFFLVVALVFVKEYRPVVSGFVLMAAVSAKLNMVLAVPFFLIYFLHNKAQFQFLSKFLKGMAFGFVVFIIPFLSSSAGIGMILNNPEMDKVYRLAVDFGDGIVIYFVPLVYFAMLYAAWRVKRLNFELFQTMLGSAFLSVVLLTPASAGWFIWIVSLLVVFQAVCGRSAIALTAVFSALYVFNYVPILDPREIVRHISATPFALPEYFSLKIVGLLHTMLLTAGVILGVLIWREMVSRNDYFRLCQKPFVLGVAGDSGAGKDTFTDAIRRLFGDHSVTILSGDDYHLWDRQKPIWQVMTHLNPMANDLEGFAKHVIALGDGKSVQLRHYNHKTGRMGHSVSVKGKDIIIASGLHALYLPLLRDCYDLSVYLDIDEDLRRYFKVARDVHQRGHDLDEVLLTLEKRERDSACFIRPQAAHADLVLSLKPLHPRILKDRKAGQSLQYKLVIRSRQGLNELLLVRALVGICGLRVDMTTNDNGSVAEFTIEGETSAQDVALAAQMVCPRIFEFLDLKPEWQDGVTGLMQLITLSHIDRALTKRFI